MTPAAAYRRPPEHGGAHGRAPGARSAPVRRRHGPRTGDGDRRVGNRHGRWWSRREAVGQRVFVVQLALVVAGLVATVGARDVDTRSLPLLVVGLVTPFLTLASVRWYRPSSAWMWRLVAIGELSWGTAVALDPRSTTHPFGLPVTVYEALSVLGYGAALGALAAMHRGTDPTGRTLTTIDSLIVLTAVFTALWGVNRWAVSTGRSDLSPFSSVLFPVADAFLAIAVVRLAARTTIARPAYLLCLAAVTTLVLADTAILLEPVESGRRITAALQYCVFAMLSLGAVHPSMASITEAQMGNLGDIGRVRILVLGAALTVPPVVVVFLGSDVGTTTALGLALGCAVSLALVLLRLTGMVAVVERQRAQLAGIARSDSLTNLPNRRTADAEIQRAIDEAALHDEPLVVGVLDLDHFKSYNDLKGHAAGDRLLSAVAGAWRRALPPDVFLGRYGGEEFVVVVRGRDLDGVGELVEALRPHMPAGSSFSAGIACWDGLEQGAVLVARADRALYAAKHAGRRATWQTVVPGREPRPVGPTGAGTSRRRGDAAGADAGEVVGEVVVPEYT